MRNFEYPFPPFTGSGTKVMEVMVEVLDHRGDKARHLNSYTVSLKKLVWHEDDYD
jgi:hypothetical protein